MEWHCDELFPRVNFIVTNLRWKSSSEVKFYNKRGTAEQWIKEGKYALNWTRLSCHDFVDNQVRLQLFALAYNLGNFLRRLALPKPVKDWSLRTLRDKLTKIGAKAVSHSRYMIFQMAEVAVPQILFREILEPDPAAAFFDNTCEAGMMCGTAENRILKWRSTVAVCQNRGEKWVLHANIPLFLCLMRHGVLNLSESW